MMRADVLQARADHAMRQFRPIAITTQVSQIQMLQLRRNDLRGDFSSGFVGKMPVPAQNALFQAPRPPRIVLEHFHVVVGLQQQNVGLTNALDHQLGGMAKIGQKTDVSPAVRSKIRPDRWHHAAR